MPVELIQEATADNKVVRQKQPEQASAYRQQAAWRSQAGRARRGDKSQLVPPRGQLDVGGDIDEPASCGRDLIRAGTGDPRTCTQNLQRKLPGVLAQFKVGQNPDIHNSHQPLARSLASADPQQGKLGLPWVRELPGRCFIRCHEVVQPGNNQRILKSSSQPALCHCIARAGPAVAAIIEKHDRAQIGNIAEIRADVLVRERS